MSQITTHVLDTSSGKPAANLFIQLEEKKNDSWTALAKGRTNNDGRIADLLAKEQVLAPGTYRMLFETGDYFMSKDSACFHPIVYIYFDVSDDSHYHIPLLLSPYGYTTYRGS